LRPSTAPRFAIGSDLALRTLAQAAFSHRRKTLRNGLKGLLSGADVEACGIDPQLRPETLTPEQFGRLADTYEHKRAADAPARNALRKRGAREG
jgi:16S rRNA (adenine1518-N6/adenine1519-N6)-dimethyltransferase